MSIFASYDVNNIFARILKGEIPCKKAGENDTALAFYDIQPQAKIHVLIIPKGNYIHALDFIQNASPDEQCGFWSLVGQVAKDHNLNPAESENGVRLITNAGTHGGQEVPHFHVHLVGGQPLGKMLTL